MTMIPFTRDLKILTSFVLKYDMAGDLRIAAVGLTLPCGTHSHNDGHPANDPVAFWM
jgi:hypothetical protein